MAQAKKIRVVVLHERGVFFDETVTGRKNEPHAMRRALHAAAEIGAGCIMRQTIGARSWAVYEYCEDDGAAHVLTGVPAIRAVEKLESALAGA